VAFVGHSPLVSRYSRRSRISNESSGRMSQTDFHEASSIIHVVDGIECREVTIDIHQTVGPVTILEATAKSQSELVDMALALNEDELMSRNQLEAGDPYGAVLWPAASAVSNYLLTECGSLEGKTILELGTGTGLVSIVASLGGAAKVIATDYEPIPLRLLEYAHAHLNKNAGIPIDTGTYSV
jgi:2-polyprenyl-3-methyl-5-hydroxy-6-metoxy-1,4-benzoquinol methylase